MKEAPGVVRSFCQDDCFLFNIDNAESISCPFDQSWYFKKNQQICQPKSFQNCFSKDTFHISYNNRCQSNEGSIPYSSSSYCN
jgi:hypothetical protein